MHYQIRFDGQILNVDLAGTLDPQSLDSLMTEVTALEADFEVLPDRIVDLTGLEGLAVGFDDVHALARRRHADLDRPFRSALVAGNAIQMGYARMYQTLVSHPLITMRVFSNRDEARRWLNE